MKLGWFVVRLDAGNYTTVTCPHQDGESAMTEARRLAKETGGTFAVVEPKAVFFTMPQPVVQMEPLDFIKHQEEQAAKEDKELRNEIPF